MWGHLPICQCPVCTCFLRLFSLIRIGDDHPRFGPWLIDRLRSLEGECRDQLQRLGPPPRIVAPAGEVPPKPAEGEEKDKATAEPPKEPNTDKEKALSATTPKVKPPTPPSNLASQGEETASTIKEEAAGSPKVSQAGAAEVEEVAPSSSKPRIESRSRQRSPKTPSEKKKEKKEHRRSEEKKSKRKRKSRSGSRQRSKSSKSPLERGRSKKRRSERPPEPYYPPARRDYHWDERAREPFYPPPGQGWRGYVPRSDHPRWTSGANKGIVKRAKQERYNQRRGQR